MVVDRWTSYYYENQRKTQILSQQIFNRYV
jgi:hypothetical protein